MFLRLVVEFCFKIDVIVWKSNKETLEPNILSFSFKIDVIVWKYWKTVLRVEGASIALK